VKVKRDGRFVTIETYAVSVGRVDSRVRVFRQVPSVLSTFHLPLFTRLPHAPPRTQASLQAHAEPERGEAVPVLRDITLSIEAGESVAIVGPSGCGKSTLLNILGTLDEADEGGVFFDGESLRGALRRSSVHCGPVRSASSSNCITYCRNARCLKMFCCLPLRSRMAPTAPRVHASCWRRSASRIAKAIARTALWR